MRQLVGMARRFSPVFALMTVAALLMLQPPARAADEMAMSPAPAPAAVSAAANVASASHGGPRAIDAAADLVQRTTSGIGHRLDPPAAGAPTGHRPMAASSGGADRSSGCVGCSSPDSPSPSPMDCVAAGCLVLMVLLVGIGGLRPRSRGRSWSLVGVAARSRLEAVLLRRWTSPPRSLVELSVCRT